jgi:hypothetical protein
MSYSREESAKVFIRKTLTHYPVQADRMDNIDPLRTRAWAFQEFHLALRVLQYTETEVVWECNTSRKCECGYWSLKKQGTTPGFKDQYCRALEPDIKTSSFAGTILVRAFTNRQLTYDSDRLIAISCLANQVMSETTGPYLAGLWRNDLPHQLLWFVEKRLGHKSRRPSTYRAPSWSWGSVEDATVHYVELTRMHQKDYKHTYHVHVLDAKCVPAGSDPTGKVSSGFVKISGPLRNTTLKELRAYPLKVNARTDHMHPDLTFQLDAEIHRDTDRSDGLRPETELYCSRVRSSSITVSPHHRAEHVHPIESIVLRMLDDEEGKYERVGYFVQDYDNIEQREPWWESAVETAVTIV